MVVVSFLCQVRRNEGFENILTEKNEDNYVVSRFCIKCAEPSPSETFPWAEVKIKVTRVLKK